MRTVTFKSVMDAIARRAALDPTDATVWDAPTQARAAEFIYAWAKKAWEWEFWPELTPIEQRAYRDTYVSTTAYATPTATAAVEVWFPPAQGYFQTLQATTNNPPAVLVNGAWVATAPFWSLSSAGYSYGTPYGELVPPDYTANDWQPNTAYVASAPGAENMVRNPGDNRFYDVITSHTSGSTFDPTKFGILTPFEQYVSLDQTGQTPIGEVRGIYRSNPRTNRRYPGPLTFIMDDKGIMPAPLAGAQVWVEFRLRPPVLTSIAYASGTTYGVGDPVYQPTTTGECYASLVAGNVGNTPETSPLSWQKQNIPYIFAEAIKLGALADFIESQGQNEKADAIRDEAEQKLMLASDVALASQAQYDRASAAVYC